MPQAHRETYSAGVRKPLTTVQNYERE